MDHPDQWAHRFIRFKDGELKDIKGAALVLRAALKDLFRQLDIDPEDVALTAALSSRAEKLDPKAPLARVGRWLADQLDLQWLPDTFSKEAHRPLHSLGGGAERDSEVKGKYQASRIRGARVLIILDDLVTRGATFAEMARAATHINPKLEVIGVALGKNEKKDFAEQFRIEVNNSHVPAEWDVLWDRAGA